MTWSGMRDASARAGMAAGASRPALPLDEEGAIEQALSLRARDMSYADLATVMGVYHGHWASADTWRSRCRNAGAPATRAYGFGHETTAAA